MDPSNFPNPYSANDGMPMFGSEGGAHWPGHENYRVEALVGYTYGSKSEFDPFFNTDSYRVDAEEKDNSEG